MKSVEEESSMGELGPVYIRADGSREIGLGHLMRCISLAHMLLRRFRILFVCRDIPDSIAAELKALDFQLVQIDNEQVFFDMLGKEAVVVLDGYDFDTTYQKKIIGIGCKLAMIDDIHDREFDADLIINHAPGLKAADYSARPDTRYLLGPDYALLRPGFLEQARRYAASHQHGGKQNPDHHSAINENSGEGRTGNHAAGETLFICFGGADIKNLTSRALRLAIAMNRFKRLIVVTGAEWPHELRVNAAHGFGVEHYRAVGEREMLRLMSESQLAIVPASGVLMEVLAAGCLAISGYYTGNQFEIYQGFKELGAIIDAKSFQEPDLQSALEEAVSGRGLRQERVIDGKSSERLLGEFAALAAC